MPVEVELVAAIERSLNTEMVDNAVFLGEQLYYCAPTDRNAELLARCYLRQNRPSVGDARKSFVFLYIYYFFFKVCERSFASRYHRRSAIFACRCVV
jgi:hypothetical protein